MDVNKHIFFDEEDIPELMDYLKQSNIAFENTNGLITFDVLQSSPYWPGIHTFVQNYQLGCISDTIFTKHELMNAEWLRVRSKWRCGYPQPEGKFDYQNITYTEDMYCRECGVGLRQIDAFRLKVLPKWGNRHFMMLNWVEDELFLDDIAKNALEERFTGFDFRVVKNKNGSDIISGVHQMSVLQHTEPGLIAQHESIRNVIVCPKCGSVKYHPSGIGMHKFQKAAFENMPDICKSHEYFGWGKGASQLIFIRQNVHRMLIKNRIEKGLVFEPVDLV